MTIPLPEGTTRKDVNVSFYRDRLKVTIAGLAQPALEGDLPGDVDMDGCYWEKEDDEVFIYMVRFFFFFRALNTVDASSSQSPLCAPCWLLLRSVFGSPFVHLFALLDLRLTWCARVVITVVRVVVREKTAELRLDFESG